ncbi:unnamed protein product [Arabis nemorensis]|uniref:Gnk2-homologous domain-containing protein n=1 Tax=Arabis nemorensis TaxID=586526 RepID=A0A565C9I2_9BRAS|nr:unnamed protein product [Arabis nemorensis]
MFGYASFSSLFILFFFANLKSYYAQQQTPNYLFHVCPNTTTYSKNSIYYSNLKSLLSSLSSTDRVFSIGFYSTVAGQSPDAVYGLFKCRGDMSPEVCHNCVDFIAKDIRSRCPERKQGIIWYDQCMLRYADQNFFLDSSLQNGTTGLVLANTSKISVSQQDRFSDLVLSTLNKAATEAQNSSRKLNARKANFTAFQTLYVMVQCTPDLQGQDCLRCLQHIITQLPTNRTGASLMVPSCSLRYELYPFYNSTALRSTQPLSPPISFPSPRHGKGGKSTVIIVAVVVPVTAISLLLVAVFIFRAKRKRTVYEMEPLAEGGKLPFLYIK